VNLSASIPRRFDTFPRIAYVNGLFIIGTLGTLITPAMFESWIPFDWSPTQLGLLAATELAGLAAGSLSGLYWQRRWNWRHVTLGSLIPAVAANLACILWHDFAAVCVARGIAGLSGGFLCAVYSAMLANARSPGRIIAITTFIQIGIEAVFIFFTTSVLDLLGGSGLFVLMTALFALLVPFVSALPPGWPADGMESVPESRHNQGSLRAYAVLLSFLPFIVVQTGVYTFLGEIGHRAAHLNSEQTMHAIGVSVLFSALGSVGAYLLDDRIGLKLPIAGAILLMIGTLLGMTFESRTAAMFLVYIALLQIAWIFLNCYLYSALIEANNLLVPAAMPLATFGSALGASAMGYVLEHDGLTGSLALAVGATVLTAFLTLPFIDPVEQSRLAETTLYQPSPRKSRSS
jgi:predicted MFS family arabinose efflux permease